MEKGKPKKSISDLAKASGRETTGRAKKDETETRTVEQKRLFPLTQAERIKLSSELVSVESKLDSLKQERKSAMDSFRSRNEDILTRREKLLKTLIGGEKERMVKTKVRVKKPVEFKGPAPVKDRADTKSVEAEEAAAP